ADAGGECGGERPGRPRGQGHHRLGSAVGSEPDVGRGAYRTQYVVNWAAAERIKTVMAKADRPIAAVRVGVKNGGCAGMAYTMEYAEAVNPLDEVIEDKGVRILVDPKAVLFLL